VTAVAGIDVGGTKCLGVLFEGGEIVNSVRRPTPHADHLVSTLAEIARELGEYKTLGIGVPGLITPAGVVRESPNLTGAIELDLRTLLQKELGHVIDVENDATCAAHAEWQYGAGRGATDMWMVTLGTGIGGGFVSGSKLQRGSHGFAGEIGHMIVESQGILCPCGQRGCWERYASGSGLATIAGGERGEEVIARAVAGDEKALGYLDTFGKWVAIGLVNLTNITDPNVIVIGGGLAEAADTVMPHIKNWFKKLLYAPDNREHPELRVAQLGESAGAIGAALLSAL